jgi:L-fucose isomerase-like protein
VGRQGYRLFFIEGEVLEASASRFQGNTAIFRPRGSAQQLLDTIMLDGWEHHIVLTMGHVAPELAALARLWNIETVAL